MGTAPFASDSGQDLLDQLVQSTDDERRAVLGDIGHDAEASVVIGDVDAELRAQALAGLEMMPRPGND
ncbi:hypothetical protein OHA72_45905 [Dactylosporangium sp. NBC_01737]|uniref:hypothetical protein n=1 Tax=Dactylosporangium sp. NBC_01737 TaxID=2975959 RepID=UPI002E0D4EB2|nr:hypothetical protein OHA72_45905 [Dactylosporangium sp. NBC_01737]